MKRKNTLSMVGMLVVLLGLFFWYRNHYHISSMDACLCTELLASASLTQNKAKIKAVRDCEMLFEDFEKAHLKCMDSVPFEHPEIQTDTIQSI